MGLLVKRNTGLPRMFDDWSLLDDFFNTSFLSPVSHDDVKVDVAEYDDKMEMVAELPGYSKDQIEIKLENGYLSLTGKVSTEKEKKDVKYIYKEIGNKSFSRKFYLGDSVDAEKVDAKFKDGVLTVTMPKSEKTKLRQIDIN